MKNIRLIQLTEAQYNVIAILTRVCLIYTPRAGTEGLSGNQLSKENRKGLDMKGIVDSDCLQQLFLDARSYNGWHDTPVTEEQLRRLYDILKMVPTAFNCCPGRFVFLRSAEAKERIKPHLRPNNIIKTMTAPVIAIIAHDIRFYECFEQLTPFRPENKDHFVGNEALSKTVAFRNGSLQGAYLMLAARAVGIDCGPMSGFDNAGVDAEFFPEGHIKSNFISGLGQGNSDSIFERLPRFDFDEVCEIL